MTLGESNYLSQGNCNSSTHFISPDLPKWFLSNQWDLGFELFNISVFEDKFAGHKEYESRSSQYTAVRQSTPLRWICSGYRLTWI